MEYLLFMRVGRAVGDEEELYVRPAVGTGYWKARHILWWSIPPVFHLAARRFDPYKLTIQTARQNRDFIDVLGNPVTEGWFFDGKQQLGDPATAQLLIPVRGSARTGNLRVRAIKENGRWRLTQLTLKVASPDKSVDLLGENPI